VLEVDAIDAFYGDSHILHGVSIRVAERARVSVLGRNGAGKSTLLKSIMNAGPRVSGRVAWRGETLGSMAAFRRARLGLALVPEDRRIFGHLTVRENIALAAYGGRADGRRFEPSTVIERIPMLLPLIDRLGGAMSGGQQQMLAVARGLAAGASLIMLDEPTEGLAPRIVEDMARDIVESCARDGVGLLLCEQNIWFARRCTDRAYVIDTGRVVFEGTWAEFDEEPEIATRYLAI
jgi:ABC-type branched-subunit amino acid transport system ATPase component